MTDAPSAATDLSNELRGRRYLFVTCFVALVATAFAFIIRVMLLDDWQVAFGLTETQKGEISGAGMWPFGISIVLFSLVIDRVGYGRSMLFALACHLVSAVLMVTANGYWTLYVGSILNGLAAGTVEAVINPAIASMYPKAKTKMLTILHAGWPGGFVLGGLMIMFLGGGVGWQVKAGVILLPVALYGAMLLKARFPVNERVAAGVSWHDMLKEAGAFGALIVMLMISIELARVLGLGDWAAYAVTAATAVGALIYTRSLGRPLYIFLLLVMILLAITELGTDGWIKSLLGPAMNDIGVDSGWIIIYTATIMMVLRFCIAPIVKVLKPLGVLLASSLLAAAGLYFLAYAEGGWLILATATIYGAGQCFFWPVTLGVVAEQFPRGGALTLNAIAGVGMLGVGIIGMPLLGFLQDVRIERTMEQDEEVYAQVMAPEPKDSVFTFVAGKYYPVDAAREALLVDTVALTDLRGRILGEASTQPATRAATGPTESGRLPVLTAAEIDRLAADPEGVLIVQRAYGRLVPAEGRQEDPEVREMVAALTEIDAFLSPSVYGQRKQLADRIDAARAGAKQNAMATIAILPLIMAACYLGLIVYFRARGGYEPVELAEAPKS